MQATTYAAIAHDHLPLPGNPRPGDLGNGELASLLVKAGVPGISQSNGRVENLKAYGDFLESIRKETADAAVRR